MARAITLALLLNLALIATGIAAESDLKLPQDPALWINSPPVTLESLRGKGVVLYFFEENCPNCTKKWPDLVRIAQENQDKPVVFLGISSGTTRGEMETYVRSNGVAWPVVLDPTRAFEKAAGVGEISLQNITQYRYITADGQMRPGNWADIPGTVAQALAGASWRVDPVGLPPTLKPAWMHVELGNYAVASPLIKKAVADKKPEIKAAGEKLQAAVEAQLAKDIAAAETAAAGNDKWAAFKSLRSVAERYKGYTLPDDFRTKGTELFKDEEVQKQLAAYEDLEVLKKGLSSGSPVVRKKTLDKLDKVIADHPGTEAAALAQEIKQQAGAQ
jgi:peroxiredoxin